jgi:hypothetical protein
MDIGVGNKLTIWQLWTIHGDPIEMVAKAAGLSPLAVSGVVTGCVTTRENYQVTLDAINKLVGTHYTLDDLDDMYFLPSDEKE